MEMESGEGKENLTGSYIQGIDNSLLIVYLALRDGESLL